jgi:hypothetical protein
MNVVRWQEGTKHAYLSERSQLYLRWFLQAPESEFPMVDD